MSLFASVGFFFHFYVFKMNEYLTKPCHQWSYMSHMPHSCPHNERNLVCNSSLFLFWFSVQNAVMESGLLLCLTDFLAQKKISPQVMRAGRLCQGKMRMNLSCRVIVVALKKKTKNCLFRRGMSYSEFNFLNVCYVRMAFATFKCWVYINCIISSCVEQVLLWYL